jgi:glycosyltransferase involved in cell wall biosynthesis
MAARPAGVLYFTNSSGRGGAEEHILTLLRHLDRTRFRPVLACSHGLAAAVAPDVPRDVPVERLELSRPLHIAGALRLLHALRARRIDILHSHQFTSSLFATPAGWVGRVPLVVETPHLRERWRKGPIKGSFLVDRLVGRFVDYYIAVSEANGRYLMEEKGLPRRKVRVILNGSDLERFRPGHPVPDGLRERLGLAPEDPVLVVLARLEPQKGHATLLQAIPAVRSSFPRVRVICAGEGSLRRDLEAQASAMGLAGVVRFVGYQARSEDFLALADVVVLPSLFEGLPLVAVEALAAQRPLLATAVDGTPEVVVDGVTGLTVPPGNAGALAAALCRLLGDPALRDRLAREGRRWVAQRFDEKRQVRATQDLYVEGLRHRLSPTAARASELGLTLFEKTPPPPAGERVRS